MEEKKLTDEEIVKALENKAMGYGAGIVGDLYQPTLNLIHRLQDENAELLEKNEKLYELGLNESTERFEDMKKIERLEDEVQRLAKVEMEHIGMIAEQKAEIERLTEERVREIAEEQYKLTLKDKVVLTREEYDGLKLIASNYEKAIKEVETKTAEKFAERLKDIAGIEYYKNGIVETKRYLVDDDDIDEICKEITEGKV